MCYEYLLKMLFSVQNTTAWSEASSRRRRRHGPTALIHLHVPLALRLKRLQLLAPDHAPVLRNGLQRIEDGRHHPLQAAEVDVRTVVELVEQLLAVLCDLPDIDGVGHLVRDNVVNPQLAGVDVPLHAVELLLVQ